MLPEIVCIGQDDAPICLVLPIEDYWQVEGASEPLSYQLLRKVVNKLLSNGGHRPMLLVYASTEDATMAALREKLNAQPRNLVLVFGERVFSALAGNDKQKLRTVRGQVLPIEGVNAPVLATYAPGAILMQRGLFAAWASDIGQALRIGFGGKVTDPGVTTYRIIQSDTEARALCAQLLETGLVSFDIETTGLNPRRDGIVAMGVSWERNKTVIIRPEQFPSLHAAFADPTPRWLSHNGQFDTAFLRNAGLPARVDHDTLLLHYCLEERSGTHGLKQLAADYLGSPNYEKDLDAYVKKHKITSYGDIPEDILFPYLAMDADYTLQLAQIFMPKVMAAEDLRRLYTKIMVPSAAVLSRIEANGVYVDRAKLEAARVERTAQKTAAMDTLTGLAALYWDRERYMADTFSKSGPKVFNPGSWKQLLWILGRQGIHVQNTQEKTLVDHPQQSDFIDALLRYREASKALSTYVEGIHDSIEPDGRVHARYLAYGTVTGRLCVSADTLVECPRDMSKYPQGIPISEIKEGQWVYSFTPDQELCLRRVKWVGKTGVKPTLKITLDAPWRSDGQTLRVTANHLVRMDNGSWKYAKDIRIGEKLLSMPRRRPTEAGEYIIFGARAERHGVRTKSQGKLYEHRWVYSQLHNMPGIPAHYDVHHVDACKVNNDPANLELATHSAHISMHQRKITREEVECAIADPSTWGHCLKVLGRKATEFGIVLPKGYTKWPVLPAKERAQDRRKRHIAERATARGSKTNWGQGGWEHINQAETKTASTPTAYRVSAIEEFGEEEVWDLEIDDTHTFIGSGVALHNSSRDPNLQNIPREKTMRDMFSAAPGRILLEVDYAQAELRVLAHLSKDPFLKDVYDRGVDLHSQVAAAVFGKDFTKEQRTYAKCFHPDTEVLTREGWRRITDVTAETDIIQAIPSDNYQVELQWVKPLEVFTTQHPAGRLVHLKNEGMDLRVTPDHRMLSYSVAGHPNVVLPEKMNGVRGWANAGTLTENGLEVDERLLRLAVATQADGSYEQRPITATAIRWGFSKERKCSRLRDLLREGEYTTGTVAAAKPVTWFRVNGELSRDIRELLDDKQFPWWWLNLSVRCREIVLDEVKYWDSHQASNWKMFSFSSVREQNIDVLQALASLTARKTRKVRKEAVRNGQPTFYLTVRDKNNSRGSNLDTVSEDYSEEVACLAVPSTFVLVRDGGVPVIVGQTLNFGIAYGLTKWGLSRQLKITPEAAEEMIEGWYARMPRAQAYLEACRRAPTQEKLLTTPFGRRRRYGLITDDNRNGIENEASNYAIQSIASDLTLLSAMEIEPQLAQYDALMVNIIHDAVLVDLPDDPAIINEVASMMIGVMRSLPTRELNTDIKFDADAKYGYHWGSMTEWEETA